MAFEGIRFKIDEILSRIDEVKKIVNTINDTYLKIKSLLTLLVSAEPGFDKPLLIKLFEGVERDPFNISAWQSFYRSLKSLVVTKVIGINCDDMLDNLDVDPALIKIKLSDDAKGFLHEISKDGVVKVKICTLVQKSTLIENLSRALERSLKVFSNIYDEEEVKRKCSNRLKESIEKTIKELDLSVIESDRLWNKLRISEFEDLVRYGITRSKLSSFLETSGPAPLISHAINQLIEIKKSIDSCEAIENIGRVLEEYNKTANISIRILNLLKKILEAYGYAQEAQTIGALYTRLINEKSFDTLIQALNTSKDIVGKLKGIDKIIDVILTKARGGRISIAEIYNGLDEAERAQGMNRLIELCLREILECTVNISV